MFLRTDDGVKFVPDGQLSFRHDAFVESDHPRDSDGKFTSGSGSTTYTKDSPPSGELHGVPFKSWKAPDTTEGWEKLASSNPKINAPPPPPVPEGKKQSSGVLIQEPDGRVWIMHPRGGYGGYKSTFPKGRQDPGLSLRATAIKEAYEETGLQVELTGYAGDFERDTTMTRYYFAKRVGGTPADHGEETEAVTLASPDQLGEFLNRTVDRRVGQRLLGMPKDMLDIADMKQVGKQLGSNPGGVFETESGDRYYVKKAKSLAHARNELLAARLYEAAGSPVLDVRPVDLGDRLGTASAWQKVAPIDRHSKEQRKTAQEDFATHAWLANWDAAGLEYDNQGSIGGKMHTLDVGGSLLFRAQGGPKGEAFGDKATEWDSLRDPKNKQSHRIYGEMTPEQLKESAAKVAAIPDETIFALVMDQGPGDADEREMLAERLIARKEYIMQRAGLSGARKDDAGFVEADHPRDDDGKFTAGSGGGAAKKLEPAKFKDGKLVTESGKPLPPHIAKLKVPPAWVDIQVNPDPNAALLVTGKDSKGRSVGIRSAAHSERQAAVKYARIAELNQKFAKIEAQNEAARKDPATRDVADCLALVMKMGIRPGSDTDTKAAVKAYGATTLQGRHVRVTPSGDVSLQFIGKKGVALNLPVEDPKLAAMLKKRKEKAGGQGRLFGEVDARRLLEHTHSLDGGGFKTKDFRTHLGTTTAAKLVASTDPPKDEKAYKRAVLYVAKVVSAKLGNTPTIALQSYINPVVFQPWQSA